MLRFLYVWLLRLHPHRFRERFGAEMLWIFDQSSQQQSAGALVADAAGSLVRQWILRPDLWQQPAPSAPRASDGVPTFYTCGMDSPRPGTLIHGGLLSAAIFAALALAIVHGGQATFGRVPGYARFALSPQARAEPATIGGGLRDSVVSFGVFLFGRPPRAVPDDAAYVAEVAALSALDADHDGVISAAEIANAPAELGALDRNHDGWLTPEELGFGVPPPAEAAARAAGRAEPPAIPPPAAAAQVALDAGFLGRASRAFMHVNPALAALDADHDGILSAAELRGASAVLKALDKNGDGRLTGDEYLPDPVIAEAVRLLVLLDVNGDGRITPEERAAPAARPFRTILQEADRDGDGVVTAEELTLVMAR